MNTPRPWSFGGDPVGDYQKIHTPGMTDERDLARSLNIDLHHILKTRVFRTDAHGPALSSGVNPRWIVAVVRADHEIDEALLTAAAREHFQVGLATPTTDPLLHERWTIGYVGPDGAMRATDAVLMVDPDAAQEGFWVAGGNEKDYHARNFNWFRECGERLADARKTAVADIRASIV